LGESTEDVMLPVSSAMLGPHASRILSAKGRSFWGAIDGHRTGMIQALWANGLDTFND
jgi:gamma-glutamylcysteine synthetase